MIAFISSAAAAFTATLIASFSGGGSSLILLPLMIFIFPIYSYIELFAVTKVAATTMTWVSASIHRRKTVVDDKLLYVMTFSGLAGTGLGTYFLQFQEYESIFKILLGITLLATSIILVKAKDLGIEKRKHHGIKHLYKKAAVACFLVNILNGIFGGTGIIITILAILALGMNFIEAISLTIISYILINTLQTLFLVSTVQLDYRLITGAITGSLFGSFMGTHLQYLKGNSWVKKAAIITMMAMSFSLLMKYIRVEFGLF